MVYITTPEGIKKKYACIKCIKGHRSSKCMHTERELLEVKKKGRPVSQCESCRFLRKTRHVHAKCKCHPRTDLLGNLRY
ncbi:copper fist DNA binding domain-containing protein [Choanephora cucurbitarum]|nr:copper fist DNA binding domain-containing protein [Choanephora cucurbitarum]